MKKKEFLTMIENEIEDNSLNIDLLNDKGVEYLVIPKIQLMDSDYDHFILVKLDDGYILIEGHCNYYYVGDPTITFSYEDINDIAEEVDPATFKESLQRSLNQMIEEIDSL